MESTADPTSELLARHRTGDRAALAHLVESYYTRVERIVSVRLGAGLRAREEVEDVVQDVFVRIIESIDRYEPRPDSNWIDWVARLAQHEISNHARHARALKRDGPVASLVREHATGASHVSIVDDATGVVSRVARAEQERLLDRCLSELSEPHREVILLRDYAACEWSAVAASFARSVEACQELHRRARRELGARMSRVAPIDGR